MYLGSDTYTEADWEAGGTSPGVQTVNLRNAAALGVAEGDVAIGTATDADGFTSEFSVLAPVVVASEGEIGQPEEEAVFLSVYDVVGREVAVLSDMWSEAGRHVLSLREAELAAGTYVVRLDGESGTASATVSILQHRLGASRHATYRAGARGAVQRHSKRKADSEGSRHLVNCKSRCYNG